MFLHGMWAELDLIQGWSQGKEGNQAQKKKNNECPGAVAFLSRFHIALPLLTDGVKRAASEHGCTLLLTTAISGRLSFHSFTKGFSV